MTKPKIECICKFCSKLFLKYQWEINQGEGKFCSQKCFHANKHRDKVEKNCEYCSKVFLISAADNDRGHGKFCSKGCGTSFKNKQRAVGKITLICINCGDSFAVIQSRAKDSRTRFCTQSCSTSYRNKNLPKRSDEEIFFENITKNENGCWEYKKLDARGYGALNNKGKAIKAHRFSYEYHICKIPDGMMICHHCDNSKCVNPLHLYPGTAKDNARDMIVRGRTQYIGKRKKPS